MSWSGGLALAGGLLLGLVVLLARLATRGPLGRGFPLLGLVALRPRRVHAGLPRGEQVGHAVALVGRGRRHRRGPRLARGALPLDHLLDGVAVLVVELRG